MEKNKHMIGNMPFEEFNKLSYREQCDYLSTLKPIATEGVDDMPLRTVEIDCSFEEYAKRYHLVSLAELQANVTQIMDKALHDRKDKEE